MDATLLAAARAATGFMPDEEGRALHDAALASKGSGPLLEIGSYLGRSTLYLAGAARARHTQLIAVDHHRGSEEHQPGWEYHDPSLVDRDSGLLDTFPGFRRAITRAGVTDVVVPVVAPAELLAAAWHGPLAMVFLDGSHTDESAQRDYECWAGKISAGGVLAIHDVFPDPADGGQAPYRVYRRALESGEFDEIGVTGSLRVLRRTAD
jgi:predicted O-methyltransferase YrrM